MVGAGPTGIETAELAEAGRAVTLVCGSVLGPHFREPARKATARRLRKLAPTSSTATARPSSRSARMPLYSPTGAGYPVARPSGPPDSAYQIWPDQESGLRTDAVGRLLTDETLTSLGDDRIVAAMMLHPLRRAPRMTASQGRDAAGARRRHCAGTHRRYRSLADQPGITHRREGGRLHAQESGAHSDSRCPDDKVLYRLHHIARPLP